MGKARILTMKRTFRRRGAVLAAALVLLCAVSFADRGGPASFAATGWALLPPAVAIVLAFATKEVYSSLLAGCVVGALLTEGIAPWRSFETLFLTLMDGIDLKIFFFDVLLGAIVVLFARSGGSRAFGEWASRRVRSRRGAVTATAGLGCLIFLDDYFNCLTVGAIMQPITDRCRVSREKLSFIIDATAAPVCIIAPISSWAAAVAGFAEDGQGLNLFIRAIPFNFYAILTIVMMVGMALMKTEFGLMKKFEDNARETGDLFSGPNPYAMMDEKMEEGKGRVLDLVLPIVVLVICCVIGMIYSGGFFSGTSFVDAFSGSDASVGLLLGSAFALVFTVAYYMIRRAMSFRDMMGCIPEGFKAMVPAILILTFAWSLKAMTDSLGAKYFVRDFVWSSAQGLQMLLPALVFVIGCLLAFATGTSWGTFGMLIPIVQNVFPMDNPLSIVCISACMAGAVCGDHCSPISDTTIMASAGAQCDHVSHVSTQLPYAITAAGVSLVSYIFAGFVPNAVIALPVAVVLMLGTLLVIRKVAR